MCCIVHSRGGSSLIWLWQRALWESLFLIPASQIHAWGFVYFLFHLMKVLNIFPWFTSEFIVLNVMKKKQTKIFEFNANLIYKYR